MTISDLRIRSKLALVLTLLFVPIVLLAWLFIQQSFKDIDFSEKESAGVAYLRGAAWPVLTDLVSAPLDAHALPPKPLKSSNVAELDARYGAAMDSGGGGEGADRVAGQDQVAAAAGAAQ